MTCESGKAALKIAIVDDHPLTRFALRSLIEERRDWEVCCECETPSELLARIASANPEVVIIDLCFEEESGLDLLQQLNKSHPGMRTLVYSGNAEKEYADRCFRFGASGYIGKEEPVRNVQTAIDCVVGGCAYVSDSLTRFTLDEAAKTLGTCQATSQHA